MVKNLKQLEGKVSFYDIASRAYKRWGGWEVLKIKSFNFEKRLQAVRDDPLKLVNLGVHAAYVKVLMGGTCTGYAMKDGKSCIICKGIHGDECRKWPYCRVSKQWMTLLGIIPENYGDMSEGLKILNFIGLAADYSSPTVQFNAMCLAHLMHTAHNGIRHGKDGLNFDIGREDDTIDWAPKTLADAAHGHRYMSNILTDRGLFGTNLCGRVSNENNKKKGKRKRENTPEDRSTYSRTDAHNTARHHRGW